MNIADEYEAWLRARHLKDCHICQRECPERPRLKDELYVAYTTFHKFYKEKYGNK